MKSSGQAVWEDPCGRANNIRSEQANERTLEKNPTVLERDFILFRMVVNPMGKQEKCKVIAGIKGLDWTLPWPLTVGLKLLDVAELHAHMLQSRCVCWVT